MMKRTYLTLAALLCLTLNAVAGNILSDTEVQLRLGYPIGASTPIGMPSTIRSLEKYTLQPNVQVGIDARKRLGSRWGVELGLHIEHKGMETDAEVKNYSMEITRGDQTLAGRFTGDVNTKATQWTATIPLSATYSIGERVTVKAGAYASYLIDGTFEGYAYDGYLRVGDPTGPKVELGNTEDTRGEYDFADKMRRMQYGVLAGADWSVAQRIGLYAELKWGFTGIHHSSFKTIEQTLYPIYGTIGITYKLKK